MRWSAGSAAAFGLAVVSLASLPGASSAVGAQSSLPPVLASFLTEEARVSPSDREALLAGTPLVMYFYALGLSKQEFVRAVSVSFFLYKVVQLIALIWFGVFTLSLVLPTLGISAVALGAFYAGQRVQDRLEQRAFNRVVLVYLGALGLWLTVRAIS